MHHNIIMAIGIFTAVIGIALLGFLGYHLYLVWCVPSDALHAASC